MSHIDVFVATANDMTKACSVCTMHATCEIPEGLDNEKTKTALVHFQWASKESVQ